MGSSLRTCTSYCSIRSKGTVESQTPPKKIVYKKDHKTDLFANCFVILDKMFRLCIF